MDPSRIRAVVLQALFADAALRQMLVFKGGNALELVHGLGARGSVDLDFSTPGEFDSPEAVGARILAALEGRFRKDGVNVFDFQFEAVPQLDGEDDTPWWGGYRATFKLIEAQLAKCLSSNVAAMQRQAMPIDARQNRTFKVDISKREYCEGKELKPFEGGTVYVYTEEMCVIEKLRAICQQLPEYGRTNPTPRARDFHDIYTAVTRLGLDLSLPENLDLFRNIFAAKHVPLSFIPRIAETREFHRLDWEQVRLSATSDILDFDTVFQFVVDLVRPLHALWDE